MSNTDSGSKKGVQCRDSSILYLDFIIRNLILELFIKIYTRLKLIMNLVKQTEYTAIVTGSTRGIGKETALLLLKNGLNVVISSKSQDNVHHAIQRNSLIDFLPKKKIF